MVKTLSKLKAEIIEMLSLQTSWTKCKVRSVTLK